MKDPETNDSPNHREPIDPWMGGEHGEGHSTSSIWDVRNGLYIDPGRSDVAK